MLEDHGAPGSAAGRGQDLRVREYHGGGLRNVARMRPLDSGPASIRPLDMTVRIWAPRGVSAVDEVEMRATFNGGIGMAIAIACGPISAAA